MGEENKPQVSFLARRNGAPDAPPPAAGQPAAPQPSVASLPAAAPKPQGSFLNLRVPAAVPPPPAPQASQAIPAPQVPQAPSALFKPKPAAPGAPASLANVSSAGPARSAIMQSGKLKAPGAKSALLPSASHKLSALRPSFTGANQSAAGMNAAAVTRSAAFPKLQSIAAPRPSIGTPAPPIPPQNPAPAMQEEPPAPQESLDAQNDPETMRLRAEQLLQQGLDHYDRGDHEQALAAYSDAIQADPSFAMAYNNLGMVLIDLERYSDAMNALYESIRHDANYGEAYNNLGFVLRRLGNNLEAASAYRRFLDLEPDVEEGERINGWIDTVLAENGLNSPPQLRLPAPQSICGIPARPAEPPKIKKMPAWEAAAGNVDMAAPVNALGEYEQEMQDAAPTLDAPRPAVPQKFPTQQMATLSGKHRTLSVAPLPPAPAPRVPGQPLSLEEQNRQTALVEKSLDEFAAGNLDEALNVATQAVEIDPENSEAHTALGKVLVRQEKLKEGIEHLEEAIRLSPLDPAPHYVLGFTLRAMDRNVEAAEIYEAFLRLMPDAIDGAKMRQWIMHVKGIAEAEASPALEDDGFIDNEPIVTETDKLYQAALERFKSSGSSLTIEDCERILAEAPEHVRTRLLLGRAQMRLGEFEKATEAFEHALSLDNDCAEATYFMGQSAEKSGDSPRALKAYRRYVEEHPRGPRVEKLRAWFLSHGVAETGKGLSQQIQCEWCLRFFDEGEISLHESKTTCNGCLTLMGSTPIQDANKLETVDPNENNAAAKSGTVKRKGSWFKKLLLGGAASVAALVAVGYFTPYLDPYLKYADPYLQKVGIDLKKIKPAPGSPQPDPQPRTQPDDSAAVAAANPGTTPGTTDGAVTPPVAPVSNIVLSPRFDPTKVKVANAPGSESSVFSKWTWKPELEGVEELDATLPGWKKEFFFKDRPLGMSVDKDGTLVWLSESKDFEALKRGEKFTVELTIKGCWIGPEGARKDLFATTKSFTLSSQFGYDVVERELDLGMASDARNIDLLSIDTDGNGTADLVITHGSMSQGAVKTVVCAADGVKPGVALAEGARYSSACPFPLNGKQNAGVLAANWKSGEVKLFLAKGGRLEAAPSVMLAPGIVSVAAMETGKNKTAVAALSSVSGTLSIAVYEQGVGFGKPISVPMAGGGGNGHVLVWNSQDLGPGFLAVTPLADEPLRFLPSANGEWNKAGAALRSAIKDEGVITAATVVSCAQSGVHRLALIVGEKKSSRLLLMDEKAGKFTLVGAKTALPGPGLGVTAWDFNKDGCDDLFVVTRDEACFYFLNEAGDAIAGPRFTNPGMLGPVVLLGTGAKARPEIAVLGENKKVRVFRSSGTERTAALKSMTDLSAPAVGFSR